MTDWPEVIDAVRRGRSAVIVPPQGPARIYVGDVDPVLEEFFNAAPPVKVGMERDGRPLMTMYIQVVGGDPNTHAHDLVAALTGAHFAIRGPVLLLGLPGETLLRLLPKLN